GRNSAYSMLKDGLIKTIKVGKKYIIPKKSVIEFIETAC
ncbi:MAG: helix-turn-helix domain-containing protein, partial [Clostridia bacterium]|nr:helix-turn-helix domain-containing protein [Clostridia bacterium]